MSNLDLLLINPGAREEVYGKLSSSLAGIEPPIWTGLVAGFIRDKGYSVKIIDAEALLLSPTQVAEAIKEANPLLANIVVLGANPSASSTPKMTAVRETINALRNISPEIKVMLSGLHPSALPEKTMTEEKPNFLCQGEGLETVKDLLATLKSGNNNYNINGLWYFEDSEIKSNPSEALVTNLDKLPFVAWDMLPMDKYRAHNWHCFDHIDQREPYAVIYTSLGCPFKCNYCNIHALYNDKAGVRYRSPENVVEEIDLLVKKYNVKNIKFLDELFALKEDRVHRICDLIIENGYDLNIWAYARVDTVNEKLLKKMRKAGINWLAYGFESASKRVRQDVDKKFNQETVTNAIKMTNDAGIYIIGNFIFGLPEDDIDTMQETLDMSKEFNFEYINFYTAMAYPGSELYRDSLEKGLKLPDNWHDYSQYSAGTIPLPTKYLSPEEVLRFRDNAFNEYLERPEYLSMIKEKFGQKVVDHIKGMLKHKLYRRILEEK